MATEESQTLQSEWRPRNMNPTTLVPIFSILLSQCLSVTLSWQSSQFDSIYIYTFFSVPPRPLRTPEGRPSGHAYWCWENSLSPGAMVLVILLCSCGLHSLLQPVFPLSFLFRWEQCACLCMDLFLLEPTLLPYQGHSPSYTLSVLYPKLTFSVGYLSSILTYTLLSSFLKNAFFLISLKMF